MIAMIATTNGSGIWDHFYQTTAALPGKAKEALAQIAPRAKSARSAIPSE